MSNAFLVLWSKDRLKDAEKSGWVGRPLPALYGGPHISHPSLMRHKVSAGDVVYPVCVSQGRLLIVARVVVKQVLAVAEFIDMQRKEMVPRVPPQTHGWLVPTCTDDAAVVAESSPLRMDCAVPEEWVEKIRMLTPKGEERAIKHVKDGKIIRTAGIDGHYYRLSEETRRMFDEVIERENVKT